MGNLVAGDNRRSSQSASIVRRGRAESPTIIRRRRPLRGSHFSYSVFGREVKSGGSSCRQGIEEIQAVHTSKPGRLAEGEVFFAQVIDRREGDIGRIMRVVTFPVHPKLADAQDVPPEIKTKIATVRRERPDA